MNRNEIKWLPFNSLIRANDVIKELQTKRNYKQMPILSEDELQNIEVMIKKAFHTKEKIQVIYFWQNNYYTKLGIIIKISTNNQQIFFDDHTSLYFEQILKIKLFSSC